MKKYIICLLLTLFPAIALCESIRLDRSTLLDFQVPEKWSRAMSPPLIIIEEMAEHIGHEAAEKGHSPTKSQLLEIAEKRLQANEVILFNENSRAHITIDFSRIGQGEKPPGKASIKLSAKYAGESLKNEEGVLDLDGRISEARIEGAWYAYRYDASYLHHDKKMFFSGIIGFSAPYWFYFYYLDYLEDPADLEKANSIFDSIVIRKGTQ